MSPIMIVSLVAMPSSLRAVRIITGLGLPTLKALMPVAVSSSDTIAPQPGRVPCLRRAVRVEIGGDQLRAAEDHLHGVLEHFEAKRAAFADDDVVGRLVDDRVAVAGAARSAGRLRR